MPLRNLVLTVSPDLTTCCLQDSCSAVLSYISNTVGAGAIAQPGLIAVALPLKGSAPTSTQSTLLKSCPGHKKNPGGCEPTGVFPWSFPGRFEISSLPGTIRGRLGHRFTTIRGEYINTVKRHRCRYRAQARTAVLAITGIRMPAQASGSC